MSLSRTLSRWRLTLRRAAAVLIVGLTLGRASNAYADLFVAGAFNTARILRYDEATGAFVGNLSDPLSGLTFPTAVRFGPDGYLYVAKRWQDGPPGRAPSGIRDHLEVRSPDLCPGVIVGRPARRDGGEQRGAHAKRSSHSPAQGQSVPA